MTTHAVRAKLLDHRAVNGSLHSHAMGANPMTMRYRHSLADDSCTNVLSSLRCLEIVTPNWPLEGLARVEISIGRDHCPSCSGQLKLLADPSGDP